MAVVVMQDGAVGWLAVFPGPVGPLLAHRSQQLLAPADRLALPCPHQVPQVMLLQGVECRACFACAIAYLVRSVHAIHVLQD